MTLNLNPQLRSSATVTGSTLQRVGSQTLSTALAALQAKYTGFVPFTGAVNQFLNAGSVDYNAVMLQLKKRFKHNYSTQVSYTYGRARGNTSGNGAAASNFQVRDDLHLELNEGPTNFDIPHNFTVSGTALVPRTGGLNVSWVARALSGSPFTSSFVATFPVSTFDNGPRTGVLPTDPFLAGGPVINTAELNRLYPGGQLLRNTGATWDNADR